MQVPNPPGQPDLYMGQPPGGSELRGGYNTIKTTPGRMTNRTLTRDFHLREWQNNYHTGIGAKQPVFMMKINPDFDTDSKKVHYDILSLPMLNYILASSDLKNFHDGKKMATPNSVKKDFMFLGINITDHSESGDAQANGPLHTVAIQGSCTMYNIFKAGALHGLNLGFTIKRVPVTSSSLEFIFNKSGTLHSNPSNNIISNDNRTMTSVLQVVPFQSLSQPTLQDLKSVINEDGVYKTYYGSYWRLGRLHTGMYIEEEAYFNNNNGMHSDVREIENTTDLIVFVNP